MSKSGHFWQWNRLLIITRTNGDCPGHTRMYSCPTYTSLQREIVTLILVDIFTLCKCDSFPWVDKSKFHGIGEDRGVPNPPVTHSQILKLHLLVKKKKRFILTNPLCKHTNKPAWPDKSHFKVTYIVKMCIECFQAFKVLGGKARITQKAREWETAHMKQLEVHIWLFCCYCSGKVITSHCCDLDYIPMGIKREMFY